MDRNRHPTTVSALPPVTSVGNPVGYFTKGDPAHGISATVPTADWANLVTEELVNVVEESAQTLNINDNKQLAKAVSSISKRKNWIINGGFDFCTYATVANNPQGYALADRWITSCVGAQMVVSQQQFFPIDTDGISHPLHFLQAQVTAGAAPTDQAFIAQVVEGVANLSGRVVTLSFWAKADANKTMAAECGQFFGTGGTPSSAVRKAFGGQLSLTTTWKKFSFTGTLPSVQDKTVGTNGNDGVGVVLYFDSGSDSYASFNASNLGHQSGTFWITRVQLEDGSLDSDWDERPLAVEQAMIQRYHCRFKPAAAIGGQVSGAGYQQGHLVKFPTTMKHVPTLSLNVSGASYTNISGVTIGNPTTDGCLLVTTSTTTAGTSSVVFGASDYIDANCELPLV